MASIHTQKQRVMDDILASAALPDKDEGDARTSLAALSKAKLDLISRLVAGAWSTGYHAGEDSRT